MIKSVTITNYLGESVKITLDEGEPEHGLIITNVEGLGPPKANINMSEMAGMDGTIFNSARVESRNIVISMLFTFSPKIEDARQRTYKYFPIKKELEMLVETDNRIAKVKGVVETNEPDIFSSNEGNSISLVCDDPYFYSLYQNVTVFFGIEPLFEFPFSNESLTDPLLIFGSIENENERTIYYGGDAEVGVSIIMHSLGEVGDITIYNTGTREMMKIINSKIRAITGSGIIAGDDIIINTTRNQKGVKLLRAGKFTNILNALDRNSDWFHLAKGDNIFAYTTEFGSENLQFKIENQILYEGI